MIMIDEESYYDIEDIEIQVSIISKTKGTLMNYQGNPILFDQESAMLNVGSVPIKIKGSRFLLGAKAYGVFNRLENKEQSNK